MREKAEIISKSLQEKDTLLREIHHRVKNNLQVISSLLGLQARYVQDDSALDALKTGQDRVKSMALIHQKLYREDNLKGIEVKDYFEKLCESLFQSYSIPSKRIKLDLQVADLNLDVDTVIPLGLIINELVSNSLKHAFPNEEEGNLTIQLSETPDQKLKLHVSDDGMGLGAEMEKKLNQSFGFRLIRSFQNQLDAEIEVDGSQGTSVTLLIKDYQKAA